MSFLSLQCRFSHQNYPHMPVLGMVTDLTGGYLLQWRDRLVAALRSMNMGDVADQTIRQLERAVRVAERHRTAKDIKGSAKVGKTVLTDHQRTEFLYYSIIGLI